MPNYKSLKLKLCKDPDNCPEMKAQKEQKPEYSDCLFLSHGDFRICEYDELNND